MRSAVASSCSGDTGIRSGADLQLGKLYRCARMSRHDVDDRAWQGRGSVAIFCKTPCCACWGVRATLVHAISDEAKPSMSATVSRGEAHACQRQLTQK
jgi:hypothetical protein